MACTNPEYKELLEFEKMFTTEKNLITKTSSHYAEIVIANSNNESFSGTLSSLLPKRQSAVFSEKQNGNLAASFAERMGVIRFLSMCSIVWGHSLLGWESAHFTNLKYTIVQSIILQAGHVGTISFFIITGYFLSDKLEQYTVLSFLRHRFRTMILPWFIFLTLFVFIELCKAISINQIINQNIGQTFLLILKLASAFIFHSAYWFVPMSILSSITIIYFKRYINKQWFGILFACITLFYSINLYHGWLPVNHTKAIMAYTFFIFIGVQLKKNIFKLNSLLAKMHWEVLWTSFALLFLIACYEGARLMGLGCTEAFSSVRLSNCFVSLVLFLILIKSTNLNWVNYFNPRTHVFGVYLIHCIILNQLSAILIHFMVTQNMFHNIVKSMLIQFSFFVLVFVVTYVIVDLIRKSPAKVIFGK